jgi:hypothetical protein
MRRDESSVSVNRHQRLSGRSPFIIEQAVMTDSSKFSSSSPKLKGAICGRTFQANCKVASFMERKVYNLVQAGQDNSTPEHSL